MNNIKSIDKDIIHASDSDLVNILLFGSSKYQYHINSKILSFSIVNEWNNLNNIIQSSELYLMFRKRMFNLIRPKCNESYGIHNPTELKLLTH